MKVALFSQDMAASAFATVFSGLAWALAENGVEAIELLTVMGDMAAAEHPFPPEARHVRLGGGGSAAAVPALARHLRRSRPDVLITGPIIPNLAGVVARQLARGWSGRLVLSHHHPIGLARGQSWKNSPLLARLLYRHADGSFAVSPAVREEAIACAGLDPARVACIPNALAPPPQAGAAPADLWPRATRPQGPVFITVSRLEPVKNLPLLLDAFARLPAAMDARLLIVGSGSQEAILLARIRALGLSSRIRLLGHVPSPRPYLRAADGFVLASDEEGFGQVLIEAMAEGLPVLSTDAQGGGVRFVLDDGRAGLLVPRGDPEALAAGMIELGEPERRAYWRAQASARVERFRPRAVGAELLAFIRSLPERSRGRRYSPLPR